MKIKTLEILSFYICLPQMIIIWCTVPEIWSSTGKIFSRFGQAWKYHQLTLAYHKWKSYDVWFLRYKVQQTEFFVDYFLPFWHPPPPKNLEIQIFDKMKKNCGRYYNLYHKCINENHMRHGFWDMECDRLDFFSLQTIFFPFASLKIRKIAILIKWKKQLEILSFYTCVS